MTEIANECPNPACKVHETGRCLEGLPLDECLTLQRAVTAELLSQPEHRPAKEELETEDLNANGSYVTMDDSFPLSLSRAGRLLKRSQMKLISIIGRHDSGKTSLVAGIYDLFQKGPIGNVSFVDSETLHGFEQRCHDSRTSSRREEAHMERTLRGGVTFFHLDVKQGLARRSILIGDRSGEEYYEILEEIQNAKSFVEIQRSSCVTLLVDSARLEADGPRHKTISETRMIAQALKETGAVSESADIVVVLTKEDFVSKSSKKARILSDFEQIVNHVRDQFKSRGNIVSSVIVAASPKLDGSKKGFGLDILLNKWLSDTETKEQVEILHAAAPRAFLSLEPRGEINDK